MEEASGHAGAIAVQIGRNLAALANPLQWPDLMNALCWLWLPVGLFHTRIGDRRLRLAIAVCTSITVPSMMVVGRITEPRVCAELTVLYWLATLHIVRSFAGGDVPPAGTA